MKIKYKMIFCSLILGLLVGCGSVEKTEEIENTNKEKFQVLKDGTFEISKDIKIFDELSSNKIIFAKISEKVKIEKGYDNVMYTYNLDTKEEEKLLETISDRYMFNNVYNINNNWLVWIESDVKMDEVSVTTGGKYIIGCKNLNTGEVFKISEMNNTSSVNPIVNVNPSEIYYDKDIIAYKIMRVENGKYVEYLENFNLKTKEKKIHHSTKDFFEDRISNVSIKGENIAFCVYPYDAFKNKNYKLFYYNINLKKK